MIISTIYAVSENIDKKPEVLFQGPEGPMREAVIDVLNGMNIPFEETKTSVK